MSVRRRSLVVVALGGLAVAAAACGLPKDGQPRVIAADKVPFSLLGPSTTAEAQSTGNQLVTLYFIAGDALRAVTRRVEDRSPVAVLNLLSSVSADDPPGLTAALPPSTQVRKAELQGDVLVVTLSNEITNVQGAGLRNALAGVVFTAYDLLAPSGVQFRFVDTDGNEQTLNAVTDEQTTTDPVRRSDYSREAPP